MEVSENETTERYQLTVKRGFLALVVMNAIQILVGLGFAYGVKFFQGANNHAGTVDIQLVGMTSALISGVVVLVWLWSDIRRIGPSLLPQIGLQKSVVDSGKVFMQLFLFLGSMHFLAWIYRSLLLPLVDKAGIIGGGSQMFSHIQETGSMSAMIGFLVLALIVGPIMEEFVFRGYLQSALATRLPVWGAITITSLIFMAGHGPTILWPMYFVFSVAWGWIFHYTGSLKVSIALHMLSNLFYTVVAFAGWNILA